MPFKPLSPKLREALARANPRPDDKPAVQGSMRVVAQGEDAVDVVIYGNIGAVWWDDESVTAKSVVDALKDFTGSVVNVRLNSYGGSVSDGIAIHNELRRHAKRGAAVNVTVDGVACSIASLIAAAGDTVTMPGNALLMLHAPWGSLYIDGNAKEIREVSEEFASLLDVMGKAMAQSYARKTGRPAEDFIAMWETGKDYWYSAEEAKAEGLCDVVDDALEPDAAYAAASADFLHDVMAHAPEALHACVRAAIRTPNTAPATAAAAPEPLATARDNQAAPSAAITPEETTMADPKKPADNSNTATQPQDTQAAVAAAHAALRDRNTEIRAIAADHMGNADVRAYVDDVIANADPATTAGDVGKQILAILAKGRAPLNGGGHVVAGADERDKRVAAMGTALDTRLGHGDRSKLQGNPFAGLNLREMARAAAEAAGVDTRGMAPDQYVRAAITHTSSDFPQLVGGSVSRAVLRGYSEWPEVFTDFTRAVSVPDFRAQSLAGLGQFVGIKKIPEGGEYPYGTFNSNGQTVQLSKRGGIFSITDEAIINDDLSLFDAVPAKMGAAAKRSLGDDVFALLTANPTMADGKPLFHVDHNNLLAAAALSTASVDAMIAKMAMQKDANGNAIRVPLKFIAVPVGLGGLARQILESQYEIGATKANTAPNYVRGRFVVIEDPRLDANSATAWYGIADPAVSDALVIAYRDGVQEPVITQKQGWNVDGIEIKVRLDAEPAIADYVGLAKNPGA